MKKQLTLCGMVVVLCLSFGCGKSDNSSSQSGSSTPAPNSASDQAPGARGVQAPAQTPAPQPIVVPAGTAIPVILSTTMNSRTSHEGDEFEGSLASPVIVDGQEAIPKGAHVTGKVVTTKAQGKFKGEAILTVKLTRINVRGKNYPIATRAFTEIEKGKGKRTAIVTGGGAALGALIGGLAGGGKGAAIGAGVGGGGGLAASGATGGKNVTLAAESRVTFRLADSLTIDPR